MEQRVFLLEKNVSEINKKLTSILASGKSLTPPKPTTPIIRRPKSSRGQSKKRKTRRNKSKRKRTRKTYKR